MNNTKHNNGCTPTRVGRGVRSDEMDEQKDKLTPRTLTVVLADTHRTNVAITCENEHVPYRRRAVQIELTDEQRRALAPSYVGEGYGGAMHEEILDCWLEPADGEGVDQ